MTKIKRINEVQLKKEVLTLHLIVTCSATSNLEWSNLNQFIELDYNELYFKKLM